MGNPIATKGKGICFAFPDVCETPAPPSLPVPIPYSNIGQLLDAINTEANILAGGEEVITNNSEIPQTTGDEAGSVGAINSDPPKSIKGKVKFKTFSQTVTANGNFIVRMFDTTEQNNGNAVGQVLGGLPSVLVGD